MHLPVEEEETNELRWYFRKATEKEVEEPITGKMGGH